MSTRAYSMTNVYSKINQACRTQIYCTGRADWIQIATHQIATQMRINPLTHMIEECVFTDVDWKKKGSIDHSKV